MPKNPITQLYEILKNAGAALDKTAFDEAAAYVEKAVVTEIKQGDFLVLEVDRPLKMEQRDAIKNNFVKAFDELGVKVLIFESGIGFKGVLRQEVAKKMLEKIED